MSLLSRGDSFTGATLNQYGYSQQVTLFRPTNVPGVAIDVGHAIAAEQNEIARR